MGTTDDYDFFNNIASTCAPPEPFTIVHTPLKVKKPNTKNQIFDFSEDALSIAEQIKKKLKE